MTPPDDILASGQIEQSAIEARVAERLAEERETIREQERARARAEILREQAEADRDRRIEDLERRQQKIAEALDKHAAAGDKLAVSVTELRRGQLSSSGKMQVVGYSAGGGGVVAGILQLIQTLAGG